MFYYIVPQLFHKSDSYPVWFRDLTWEYIWPIPWEKSHRHTQVCEPCHITIKRNPSISPEGWWWRLSVWKFFQSNSKSSRTPMNPSQLHTVQALKLWDSSESSKKSSSCQNLSKSKIQKSYRKSKRKLFQHPGVCGLLLSLASVSVHESTIRKKLERNEIHGRVPTQKPPLARKGKWTLVSGLPKSA